MSYQQGGGGQGAGGGQGSQGQGGMGSGSTIIPGQHGAGTPYQGDPGAGGWDPNAGTYGVRTKYNDDGAWVYTGTYATYNEALKVFNAQVSTNPNVWCDLTQSPGTVLLSHTGRNEDYVDPGTPDTPGTPAFAVDGVGGALMVIMIGTVAMAIAYVIMKGGQG